MGFQLSILALVSSFLLIHAQQPYIRRASTNCSLTDNSTSILGYTCNGQSSTCQSYLVFRSQPPYNSVSSISALLSSNPLQLSQVNAVPANSTFATNTEVIVPVNCSCSGENYQANSSYVFQGGDSYFAIANNTYQGLSTCHALQNQNNFSTLSLSPGNRITVPLRCACPTQNQTAEGLNYLVTYIITWSDSVWSVSSRFGVDTGRTLIANGISAQDPNIYPFTTLLIPLQSPPNSQTIVPSSPSPPPPPPPAPTSPSGGNTNTWVYIVIGVVCAVVLALAFFAIVFCVYFRKRKTKIESNKISGDPILDSQSFESHDKTHGKSLAESNEFLDSISDIAQSLKIYKFGQLQSATNNFSPKYLVKGSVYRGTINGSLAAIKKTNKDVATEINILDKINHFSLIKLSGVCFSQGYWYLVYEYALNGSLTDWIHYSGTSSDKVLSWSQRIQIALDVASGLNYLHSYTTPPHVHKDINASNVLLDIDFRAKIANFSLAKSAEGQGGEFALTRHIVGTKGYMAPEYLEDGYISPKLDVYSFGILMLEILTGKQTSAASGTEQVFLPEALSLILGEKNPEEKLKDFIDPSLQGDYPLDLALLLATLIDKCLRREPERRPAMHDIVHTLTAISSTSNWEAVKLKIQIKVPTEIVY